MTMNDIPIPASLLKFSEQAIKSRIISARKVNCGNFYMIEMWDVEVLK